jgi:transposase
LLVDRNGIPLAVTLTAGNVHDSQEFENLLDRLPRFRNHFGRPTWKPDKVHADKGYDYTCCRFACFKRRIQARIARRKVDSSEKLGRHRWVVERSFAWIHRFRRLAVRYERRADIHMAFLLMALSLICYSFI